MAAWPCASRGDAPVSDKPYPGHHAAVCGNDHLLAKFMYHVSSFLAGTPKAARFIDDDGIERDGIARTWNQWEEELGVTRKMFRGVRARAIRNGYIVRARRAWNGEIRLHVAVTEAYVVELTRCVSLGPKAYRRAILDARRQAAALAEGQFQVALPGNSEVPSEGNTKVPSEGNYIKDSSLTLSETLSETATLRCAEGTLPRSVRQKEHDSGEEKSMTLPPHSPPSPEPTQGVVGEDGASITTVTSQGLATKFRDLGYLAEWQRACARCKCPSIEVSTDEQLAALSWWCGNMFKKRCRPDEVPTQTLLRWPELVAGFSATDEAQGLDLQQYVERPSLEFVRHAAELLKAGKATPLPD